MSGNPPFVKWSDDFLHIYRGIVRNNIDPLQAGRCQIEIWPMFFNINPTDLPWAIPATNIFEGSGSGTGTFAVPQVNSLVWCFFEEGNYYQPVYFAEAPDLVHGVPPEALINYPNRKVWKTVSGITMIFDNTTGLAQLIDVTGEKLMQSGMVTMWGGVVAPSGHLLCDGTSYLISSYPTLYAAIGTANGSVDSNHFNVPDFRGMFPRGVDNGAGNDPDTIIRTAANLGGNVGDEVGSVQQDGFKTHTHTYGGVNGAQSSTQVGVPNNEGSGFLTAPTGGNETRPKNVYINFIIKI